MKVAILGCGPSGLVAAHAAALAGADITIYSKHRKSELHGAQYLHNPIPEIDCGEPAELRYTLQGTVDQYRDKVYGKESNAEVSPTSFTGSSHAYDIRLAYDGLWNKYEGSIEDTMVSPSWLVGSLSTAFDYVLCTIPFPQLCVKGHTFASQDIWAMGDAPERGQVVPFRAPQDNTVMCNGEDEPAWYRLSTIFEHTTVEWSTVGRRPPLPCAQVAKPLFTNCSCWPDISRVGRYGLWQKGVLVHHAFMMAYDIVTGELDPGLTRTHVPPCPWADPAVSDQVAEQLGCSCGAD